VPATIKPQPGQAVVPIGGVRQGTYVVLEAALPDRTPQPIGVVLIDPATNRGWVRLLPAFDHLTNDTEVLDALEDDLRTQIANAGAEAFLRSLEDSLSNVVRVGERMSVVVDAFTRVVERLYVEHVGQVVVRPFETHLPVYSVQAAAGGLSEEREVEMDVEAWVPAPEGIHLSKDMFVAHVVGRSMEPRIPDGSLNLFRLNPQGSRSGKCLLIERFGITDQSARYTVKIYTSEKDKHPDGQWEHKSITLKPLNREFSEWNVEPQDFAVIAEWLRVIE
jgi:SOS-response transcriptional repressor LexA